jgi:hypothetical protein
VPHTTSAVTWQLNETDREAVSVRDFLVARVEGKPDITMPELARRLEDEHGLVIPPS